MNKGAKEFSLLLWALIAAINFGVWQGNVCAGLFAFFALVVLDQRS